MRGTPALGRKSRLVSVLAIAAGLGLAGCSDLDSSLFPDDTDTGVPSATASADQGAPSGGGTMPGTMPGSGGASGGSAPVVAITPVPIEPGANTGTGVSTTIATLRGQVQTLEDHLAANAAKLT